MLFFDSYLVLLKISYVPLESGRNVFAQPPMSRLVMEHPGHAQVATLLVSLVWRQVERAGWTAATLQTAIRALGATVGVNDKDLRGTVVSETELKLDAS